MKDILLSVGVTMTYYKVGIGVQWWGWMCLQYLLSFHVCIKVHNATSHNVCKSYSTFGLPIETLQLIEDAFEDLWVLHGDLEFVDVCL